MNTLMTLWTALTLDAGVQQTFVGAQGEALGWQTKAVLAATMPMTETWSLVGVAHYGLEHKDRYYGLGVSFKLK